MLLGHEPDSYGEVSTNCSDLKQQCCQPTRGPLSQAADDAAVLLDNYFGPTSSYLFDLEAPSASNAYGGGGGPSRGGQEHNNISSSGSGSDVGGGSGSGKGSGHDYTGSYGSCSSGRPIHPQSTFPNAPAAAPAAPRHDAPLGSSGVLAADAR